MTETKTIHGVKTAYRHTGEGRAVILLHGWGQNMAMMANIEAHLSPFFSVWNLDFPGFGESDVVPAAWSVEDYTDFLRDFITENGIEEPILIGHSFGCRVAIRYAVRYPVRKMCLTGAAGIRGFPPPGPFFISKLMGGSSATLQPIAYCESGKSSAIKKNLRYFIKLKYS